MQKGAETIICNTGPLIALAKLRQLTLLTQLFEHVLVPTAVWRELTQTPRTPEELNLYVDASRFEIVTTPAADPLLETHLDEGEAAVLTLARAHPGSAVLIDERRARRVATVVYNMAVIGTGGLLLRAKRAGLISDLRSLLESLLAHNYYISEQVIERICFEASEMMLHEPRRQYSTVQIARS